jgi:hypothetical protein
VFQTIEANLNQHVSWELVARLLSIPVSSRALPLQTKCPFCQSGLFTIYEDTRSTGQWHHCPGCKRSGDMIELAAAYWNLSLTVAIDRLAESGVPFPFQESKSTGIAVSRYIEQHPGFRRRLSEFWRLAQHQGLNTTPGFNSLRRKLHLVTEISRDRQLSGPLQLYGMVHRNDTAVLGDNPLAGCRKQWQEAIVIPYYSAPDQLTGFGLIGDGVSGYQTILDRHRSREIGLAGLQSLDAANSSGVVAVSDPKLMLRLQVKHFNTSLKPLPLVVWQEDSTGKTRRAWQALGPKQLVFWSFEVTPELILQCRETDAHLCLLGPKTDSEFTLDHYLRLSPPSDLIRRVMRSARPWREALASWAKKANEAEVSAIYRRLFEVDEDLVISLMKQTPSSVPDVPRLNVRTVKLDSGLTVIERNDRWYAPASPTDKLLFDGAVRIEKVVHCHDKVTYHGYVRHDGVKYPFDVPNQLPINTAVRRCLLAHGKSVQVSKRVPLGEVAIRFHEPVVLQGFPAVGWDGTGYVFRNFRVTAGKVHEHSDQLLPSDCPGPSISAFKFGKTMPARATPAGPEAEVAWNVLTAVLTLTLARAGLWEAQPVVFSGDSLKPFLAPLLSRLGVETSKLTNVHNSGEFVDVSYPHNWPLHIETHRPILLHALMSWLSRHSHDPFLVTATPAAAYLAALQGVRVIHYDGPLRVRAVADMPIEHIVPAFLKHFTRRERAVPEGLTPWAATSQFLKEWLASEGGNPAVLDNAGHWLTEPTESQRIITRLLVGLYRSGDLYVFSDNAAPTVSFSTEGLIVPHGQVHAAFMRMKLPLIDLSNWPDPILVPGREFMACHASR